MSLIGVTDLDYYIIQLCDLKSILNLLVLNWNSYDFITSLVFYEQLQKVKGSSNKRRAIFKNGYLNLIRILFNDINIKYSKSEIYWASANRHINVLEWFKNSGIKLKYSNRAIDRASQNGHINVLEWFKNNNLN